MTQIFDLFTPFSAAPGAALADLEGHLARGLASTEGELSAQRDTTRIMSRAAEVQIGRIAETHAERGSALADEARGFLEALSQAQRSGGLAAAWAEYLRDATERATLTADALRKRGDIFVSHEAAGCPPVLNYEYDIVMDGADLPYPSNYILLKIKPPKGVRVHARKRPYIVIDPRAGHGPGIGGFKSDSQVGVALRAGHPVYFVAFRRAPEPGQFLSYVTRTEAAFVREVMRRHPHSNAPVIIGNCQGGWATLLLAATNPDLTGPIVINGAPVAPWAGKVGENPMRYNAGVLGGTWVPMLLSDLGGGIFDGAHLVQNFELLNPGRTLFRKYADLFRDIDAGDQRFLDFETWWGGFFLLTEPEIRWIVEQLFVGNRLVKNEARIEPGRPVDLKAIRAPIIVFASHGDNITPPQQALNWIAETYADVNEIRIRGQRIIYMVHDQVGHLGIFVSSQIARREHSEMASTMKTIEALPPGLYEMRIEDVTETDSKTHFTVGFAERSLEDIRALDDGFADERPFAAVARASEIQAQLYEGLVRPAVKAMVTPAMAEASRSLHPQRVARAAMSSRNPAMAMVETAAETVRDARHPAAPTNPFLAAEALWVSGVEQAFDLWRDWRDMAYEMTFYTAWSTPWARAFGQSHETRRTLKSSDEVRGLPEVAQALMLIDHGGFVEAVIRMLILLAESRGDVRRDRLERSSRVLSHDAPFAGLSAERRAIIIHQQTLIASYEPDRAMAALPKLLQDPADRQLALDVVRFIVGAQDEMSETTRGVFARFAEHLELDLPMTDINDDPLGQEAWITRHAAASAPDAAPKADATTDEPTPPRKRRRAASRPRKTGANS